MLEPATLTRPAGAFSLGLVTTREEWDQVRALRYRALSCRGEIAEDASMRLGDEHDRAMHAMTFLLSRNGRPAGTTRTMLSAEDRRWPIPALAVFPREIESTLGTDVALVEAGFTVVEPALLDDGANALFHLFRAALIHCTLDNADWVVMAVLEARIGYYRRMFNMEILSGAEAWPGMKSKRVLMGLDVRAQMRFLTKRIPALAIAADELDAIAQSRHPQEARWRPGVAQ